MTNKNKIVMIDGNNKVFQIFTKILIKLIFSRPEMRFKNFKNICQSRIDFYIS